MIRITLVRIRITAFTAATNPIDSRCGPRTLSASGPTPLAAARSWASVGRGPESTPGSGSTTARSPRPGIPSGSSGVDPPRTGSGSRNTYQARTKAGRASITKAARHDSAAMSPVTANPIPAPTNSPVRM